MYYFAEDILEEMNINIRITEASVNTSLMLPVCLHTLNLHQCYLLF